MSADEIANATYQARGGRGRSTIPQTFSVTDAKSLSPEHERRAPPRVLGVLSSSGSGTVLMTASSSLGRAGCAAARGRRLRGLVLSSPSIA